MGAAPRETKLLAGEPHRGVQFGCPGLAGSLSVQPGPLARLLGSVPVLALLPPALVLTDTRESIGVHPGHAARVSAFACFPVLRPVGVGLWRVVLASLGIVRCVVALVLLPALGRDNRRPAE